MVKIFRKIHLWLSVPFGIIITLICFSGAMLVFEPEITRSIRSKVYYVASSQGEPLPMDTLMGKIKSILPDSVSITGVTVFADKDRTYQVSLSKPRRASMFIDQYSGDITGKYERLKFFSIMIRLHRWLLDSSNPHGEGVKTGKLIVGISTVIFVISLITGVVIWWPRVRNGFRRSLKITTKKGWRGFWKSLHVAGGMYVLVLVLVMALTGLTWSFDWYRSAFYAVCGVEYTPRGHSAKNAKNNHDVYEVGRKRMTEWKGHIETHHKQSEFDGWQQVYNELKSHNPEAPQITIGVDKASVAHGDAGNGRASDTYIYNHGPDKVRLSVRYVDSAPADKWRGWIYSIHTGSFGGLITRILWFISALLGANLPITGYYIWIRHLMKRNHEV